MNPAIPLLEAAREVKHVLDGLNLKSVLIGGVAVFRWGLRTCSAEDLIVLKAFAGRDIDLMDIKGIIKRQRGRLDWNLIERELRPLLELKEDLEAWARLQELKRQIDPAG